MAKTKSRWIIGVGATPDGYNLPDALTANNIWFDATTNIKDAILDSAGSIGVTGIQGITGPSGGDPGAQGETGLSGGAGPAGVTGLRGLAGSQGLIGPTGVEGPSVISSEIPSNYITVTGPIDATVGTWSDIPGLTVDVILDSSSNIFGTFSFEAESASAGSYPTGGFRVVINDTSSGSELDKFFLPDDVAIGTVTHYAGPFTPASYKVKGQIRRISGSQTVRLNSAQLYAHAFIGGKGDLGPLGETGIRGVTGFGVQGDTGVQGYRGERGHTGIEGIQGIQGLGLTGLQGMTGVIGPTGVGPQGVTGVISAVALPSSFLSLDSTNQFYDNSTFIKIPGLSDMTVAVTATGSYIFSSLTLETDSSASVSDSSYATGTFNIVVDTSQGIEFSRFVQNDDDLEVDTITFRAGPFDPGLYTVSGQVKKDDGDRHFRIRKGILYAQTLQGGLGPKGDVGSIGYTGILGPVGGTGIQGGTGLLGLTGLVGFGQTGIQGNTGVRGIVGPTGPYGGPPGDQGVTGIRGITGLMGGGGTGIQGVTGVGSGVTGLCGPTGVQGTTGLMGGGSTGIQGTTGVKGTTGIQGVTGASGVPTDYFYTPVSRYNVVNTAGAEVWLVSSSTVHKGLNWTRSGTSLTLSRTAHGHAGGNRVIVRNTNQDYLSATIDSTTANAFIVTTADTGDSVGVEGVYSLGFTYAHSGSPASGGTLYAPSGNPADVQLLSMRIRTGARTGTTYDVVLPASAVNGAGANTSLADCYIPDFSVRYDSDSLNAVASTVSTNIGSSYSTFEFDNLGLGSLSRFIILHF